MDFEGNLKSKPFSGKCLKLIKRYKFGSEYDGYLTELLSMWRMGCRNRARKLEKKHRLRKYVFNDKKRYGSLMCTNHLIII